MIATLQFSLPDEAEAFKLAVEARRLVDWVGTTREALCVLLDQWEEVLENENHTGPAVYTVFGIRAAIEAFDGEMASVRDLLEL